MQRKFSSNSNGTAMPTKTGTASWKVERKSQKSQRSKEKKCMQMMEDDGCGTKQTETKQQVTGNKDEYCQAR